MHSEIFRFALVRPPEGTAALGRELTPFVLDAPDSKLIAALRRSQLSGDRAAMIRQCTAFVGGANYLSKNSQVDPALLKVSETLSLLAPTGFQHEAGERIQEILGIAPSVYVRGDAYTKSLSAITESIVAACISGAGSAKSKALQISVGRALYAISLLADNQAFSKQNIQTSTFVLPSGIFPVPLVDTNLKAQRQQRADIRSKATLERTKELERLASNLAGYKSASNELLQALDVSVSNSPPQERPAKTGGFRLTAAATQKLSAATKSVLKQSGQSDREVDVANAIANLERRMADTAHELFAKAGTAAPLIRRGNNWFAGIDVDLPMFELSPVSSRVPGLCPPVAVDEVDVSTPVVSNGKHDVRVVGIADLLLVEQELVRYQYGEISHVENVMKSEFRDRKHRISQLNEEIDTTETSTSDLKSNDLTASERFELQTEAQKVINETSAMNIGTSVSASYGPVTSSANFNYSSSDSLSESQRVASEFARETVAKTVTRIENRSLQRNVSRSVREVEETNQHTFDNKAGSNHITGMYRFIDKIYSAQIVNYGRRLMLEFVVPEPGAFLRHAFTRRPADITVERPVEPGYCTNNGKTFVPLQVHDIDRVSYLYWASKYNVEGITPPPSQTVVVSRAIATGFKQIEHVSDELVGISDISIEIPAGYMPVNADVVVDALLEQSEDHTHAGFAHVLIDRLNLKNNGLNHITFTPGAWKSVAVAVNTFKKVSYAVVVNIFCRATAEEEEKWKLATYNLIMNAYKDKLNQFETALEAERIRSGFTEIQGTNPLANRETEKTELKRGCISLLTGQQFESFDAMNRHIGVNGYPEIDFDEAAEEGKFISFFEQAFEWNNMTYVFYPYFWSNKDQWALLSQLKDNDPQFLKFLQSGSSRVNIPVRPGFESSIMNYLTLNTIWNADGNLLNAEDGEPEQAHLAVIEEIKSQLNNMFSPGPGLLSVTQGSKQVSGSNTAFTADDIRKRIIIAGKTYLVHEVISPTSIVLSAAYEGTNENGIPYEFGAKLVGEPWEVKLPTNLVAIDDGLQISR